MNRFQSASFDGIIHSEAKAKARWKDQIEPLAHWTGGGVRGAGGRGGGAPTVVHNETIAQ